MVELGTKGTRLWTGLVAKKRQLLVGILVGTALLKREPAVRLDILQTRGFHPIDLLTHPMRRSAWRIGAALTFLRRMGITEGEGRAHDGGDGRGSRFEDLDQAAARGVKKWCKNKTKE